jgi:hypothetical protein
MAQTFVSNTYTSDTTITIPSNAAGVNIKIQAGRGGTGGSDAAQVGGGGNSGRYGDLSFYQNFVGRNLYLAIGGIGGNGNSNTNSQAINTNGGSSAVAIGGYGGHPGPNGSSGQGGAGGGAAGVYDSIANAWIIVAGGGGGGGGASYPGGLNGQSGFVGADWYGTGGISFSAGGQGASQGNDGGGGGGGGGGATGGAGGYEGIDGNRGGGGGGGGGSAFRNDYLTLNGSTTNFTNSYITVSYTLYTPTINSFTASPNPQTSGNDGIPNYDTTLTWTASDVLTFSLDNGIGVITGGTYAVSNLPQSTAGSNSPASRSYTLSACTGTVCATSTITVDAYNDNVPTDNFNVIDRTNLEPNTTYTYAIGQLTGVDMGTNIVGGPGVSVSSNNSTYSSSVNATAGLQLYIRFVSLDFNKNPSGLTNSKSLYVDIGPLRKFFTATTRAPDVNETFNLANKSDALPFPDIDTIASPSPTQYLVSDTLSVDDIELADPDGVEIKVNQPSAQVRKKISGSTTWGAWTDVRSI